MELPDITQNFIHPTPGGEEGHSAALAAGAARDGVAQSPPVALDFDNCRCTTMLYRSCSLAHLAT